MSLSVNSWSWDRVLIDVCTQRDFLDPGSILQVANLDRLLPNLKRIFERASAARIPIVSTVESHRPSEPPNGFPLHCIDGTPGQQKLPFTCLTPRVAVETDNYLSLPPDLRQKYIQLIFRKRSREVFGNPKADRFLTQLQPETFIIFGVGLERAIKSLALGLLARHKHVAVIADACGYWSAADAELAARQLGAKNVRLMSTEEFVTPEPTLPRLTLRTRRFRSRHHPVETASRRRARSGAAKRCP